MAYPRLLLAAAASGSGKTMITCGLLQALKNRGLKVASFKCGPDYIDPMFHERVIGTRAKNLDTFFAGENDTRYLFAMDAEGMDISVMEGVMGYYDGVGGTTTQAGAYDLARVTRTPAILIVNTKGMSLSVAAIVKGFAEFVPDSQIKGVILNQMSPMLYPRIKEQVESLTGIHCYGYVPVIKDFVIESRHLGLVLPAEVAELNEKLNGLAKVLEESLDIDDLLELAAGAPELSFTEPRLPDRPDRRKVRIGLAMDEAFCFYYKDNLELLRRLGAELVYFSPIHDKELPGDLAGLIFEGGYPELHAGDLAANTSMLESVRQAIQGGMPVLAECGGFMYLHKKMEDMDHNKYDMVGIIDGEAYRTPRLNRFGYITLTSNRDGLCGPAGTSFKAHEFHYFESTACGDGWHARKPAAKRSWECIQMYDNIQVGFPHLYYYSNPQALAHFLDRCADFAEAGAHHHAND